MERLIFGIAGEAGSGKSTLGSYLEVEHGFTVLEGSTIIREHAAIMGVELTDRSSYTSFHRKCQKLFGKTWLSDRMLASPANRIVNAGLRNKDDAKNFLDAGGINIALYCPQDLRFARVDHTDPKQKPDLESFIQMERDELSTDEYGVHTDWVMEHATVGIDSSRPPEHVQAAADALVAHFSK